MIDEEVWRVFDEQPQEKHALILVARLDQPLIDIETILPSSDEYNADAALWVAWEQMKLDCEQGEGATEDDVASAFSEARAFSEALRDRRDEATLVYMDYYSAAAQEAAWCAYTALIESGAKGMLQPTGGSLELTILCDREDIALLASCDRLERVSIDHAVDLMLDTSRQVIRADDVHDGVGGVGPYTGAGVRVALVDTGMATDHPRLPDAASANKKDFSSDEAQCLTDPTNTCSAEHGTQVGGVLFCQPADPDPGYVGIAYQATPVVARILTAMAQCQHNSQCPWDQLGCDDAYPIGTWSRDWQALRWCVLPTGPDPGPMAEVINYSRGYYGTGKSLATAIESLNADWLVQTGGSLLVNACGNHGNPRLDDFSAPNGAYNCVSVGATDDRGTVSLSDDIMWSQSSYGPTHDGRRKPDLSAPGHSIMTPTFAISFINCQPLFFLGPLSGTSFAAPHIVGTSALLLEARPSLTPRQIHAILIESSEYLPALGQQDWHDRAGWGCVNAYEAVRLRNYTVDGALSAPAAIQSFTLSIVPPADPVRVTGVWHRGMASESQPVVDSLGNAAPANLDLILESSVLGSGVWSEIDNTQNDYLGSDGIIENSVRRVTGIQAPEGQPQSLFRIKVLHRPTQDSPYQGSQSFSLAARHALFVGP